MIAFGYNIDKLAQQQAELGLTNQEIARRAHVHPSTVGNVMKGRTAKAPTVKKIAAALGVKLPELVVARQVGPAP